MNHLDSAAHCNSASPAAVQPDGADCEFQYTIIGLKKRQGLEAVQEDAQNILVPGLSKTSTIANDLENQELFDPGLIDVTACATVPPIIPNFGPLQMSPTYAIGRAAATNVMVEEDWLQPGAVYDPTGRPANTVFQPVESYTDFTPGSDTSESYNWYGVDFGGNAAVAYVNYGVFNQPTYDNEFSVRLGWWNAIAYKPFVSPAPAVTSICKPQ
jgi:hypothetical protein